jgi:ERF superfamily
MAKKSELTVVGDHKAQAPAGGGRGGPMSPGDMVQRAIELGNVEVIGKLLDYQERWEKALARKAFDIAIAAAKAKIPVIIKDRTVDFANRSAGGRTNYKYEDFAGIARVVDPILSENGLSCRFRTVCENNVVTVICIIAHRDGYFEENSLSAKPDTSGNKNDIQAVGSTQTYLQRYTLKAALGLAASSDDDGTAVDNTTVSKEQLDKINAACGNINKKALLNYMSKQIGMTLETLDDIPARAFADTMAAIERKKANDATSNQKG